MHHPTITLDGERWNVVATSPNGVTVSRNGQARFVKHEDVR